MGRAGHFELVGHVRTHGAQFLAVHKYAAVVVDRVEMHKRALAPLQPRQHELPLQVVIPERAQRRGHGDRIVECAVNVPLPRAVERHARAGTRSIGNSRRGGNLGRSKHRLPEAITRAPEARHQRRLPAASAPACALARSAARHSSASATASSTYCSICSRVSPCG